MSTPPSGGQQPPSNWQPAPGPGPQGQPPQGQFPQGQYPQGQPGAYGQPGPYGQPAAAVAFSQPPAQQQKSRKPLIIGGAIVAAAALGVGGWAIANNMGGGATGELAQALPAESYGYMEIDMGMGAGEKIKAARFYEQLPQEVREAFDEDDPQRVILGGLMNDNITTVEYEQHVAPWIGDSMAIAAVPGDTDPVYVLVLETDNTRRAEKALADPEVARSLFGEKDNWFMHNGYVVSGEDSATTASVSSALGSGSSLQDSGTFAEDMARLGEKGIASMWVNGEYVNDDSPTMPYATGADAAVNDALKSLGAESRAAMTLRVEADHLELDAHGIGNPEDVLAPNPVGTRTVAPEGAALSVHATGMGGAVGEAWGALVDSDPSIQDTFDTLGEYFDVTFPDDLVTLAGDSTSIVVHDFNPNAISATGELPGVSIRGYGDAAAMEQSAAGLEEMAGEVFGTALPMVETGDGIVLGTREDIALAHASSLMLADATESEALLEDPEGANAAVQADLDQWEPLYMNELRASREHNEWAPLVESFSRAGITMHAVDAESNRVVVRIN